jgi:hypothetical protein
MTERKFTPYVDDGSITEYVTTCGLLARVSAASSNVLFGYVKTKASGWQMKTWFIDGSCHDSGMKLHDIPVKHTFCINLYKNGCISTHSSSVSANGYGHLNGSDIIGRKEISIEEGEGL